MTMDVDQSCIGDLTAGQSSLENIDVGGSVVKDFAGKIAVVTGGGSGMGRELVRQLVSERCNVAMCDLSMQSIAETKRWWSRDRCCRVRASQPIVVDVSDEAQVIALPL